MQSTHPGTQQVLSDDLHAEEDARTNALKALQDPGNALAAEQPSPPNEENKSIDIPSKSGTKAKEIELGNAEDSKDLPNILR